MVAPTVDQLVSSFLAPPLGVTAEQVRAQSGAGQGFQATLQQLFPDLTGNALALQSRRLLNPGLTDADFISQADISFGRALGIPEQILIGAGATGAAPQGGGGGGPSVVGDTGQFVTTGAPGELNVPFGADFLDPSLDLFGLLAQLQQQQQQFGLTFPEQQRQFDVGESFRQQQFAENVRMFGIDEAFRRAQLTQQGGQFDVDEAFRRAQLTQQGGQFGQTLAEQSRQFDVGALQNAAAQLAGLRAQGPQSAAELAFAQAGMGLPALGGSGQNIAGLLGASTRGATGQSPLNFGGAPFGPQISPQLGPALGRFAEPGGLPGISAGPGIADLSQISPQLTSAATTPFAGPPQAGQQINIPNTLGGQQLAQLQGNPNLAGVLGSFAKAAGNPDLFSRSIAALLPSGFQPTGSGF